MSTSMFCYQCEQTAKGEGCTKIGVCGKEPDVATIQDLMVHTLSGLAVYAVEGRKVGVVDQEVNRFTMKALFSTLTNVDFDPERFADLINRCVAIRDAFKEKVRAAGGRVDFREDAVNYKPAGNLEAMIEQGLAVG